MSEINLNASAVDVTDLRSSEKVEGRMVFTATPRTKAQAKRAATAATVEDAVRACSAILSGMSQQDRKSVLSALTR